MSIGVASSALGDHLVGPNGHALYVFSNDSANTSACSGGCAATWPPLSVGAGQTPAAGTGVTATVGAITREDGTLQVTANGMPLYYYAPDVSETDITGQGVGGVWFLAAPDGLPLGGAAGGTTPASAPAATDGYGGYGG